MNELLELLAKTAPGVNFEAEKHIISNQVIDSMTFLMIITNICDYYKIDIPIEEMLPENFDSVESILLLINKLLKK